MFCALLEVQRAEPPTETSRVTLMSSVWIAVEQTGHNYVKKHLCDEHHAHLGMMRSMARQVASEA